MFFVKKQLGGVKKQLGGVKKGSNIINSVKKNNSEEFISKLSLDEMKREASKIKHHQACQQSFKDVRAISLSNLILSKMDTFLDKDA